jgi:hypothetical protein
MPGCPAAAGSAKAWLLLLLHLLPALHGRHNITSSILYPDILISTAMRGNFTHNKIYEACIVPYMCQRPPW